MHARLELFFFVKWCQVPEMGDPADGRPQQRIATRRNKLGEEDPRGGAYPPPASAKLDLTSLQLA